MQTLAEKLLRVFCKHPSRVPGFEGHLEEQPPNPWPLRRLTECFPGIKSMVRGRRVLDFGSGSGEQVIALAQAGATEVVGVEIQEHLLQRAQRLTHDMPQVSFSRDIPGMFDLIICQDVFEHIAEPEQALENMLNHLRPGGKILLTFGPLWYSPYGAHCHYFTSLPWVHLIFSESTVHRVMALYRRNPGLSYREEMNMMTARRFSRIMRSSTASFEQVKYRCVKGLNFLAYAPLLRELFVNEISCVVQKSGL